MFDKFINIEKKMKIFRKFKKKREQCTTHFYPIVPVVFSLSFIYLISTVREG